MSNYNQLFYLDVITYPCTNFHADLTNLCKYTRSHIDGNDLNLET